MQKAAREEAERRAAAEAAAKAAAAAEAAAKEAAERKRKEEEEATARRAAEEVRVSAVVAVMAHLDPAAGAHEHSLQRGIFLPACIFVYRRGIHAGESAHAHACLHRASTCMEPRLGALTLALVCVPPQARKKEADAKAAAAAEAAAKAGAAQAGAAGAGAAGGKAGDAGGGAKPAPDKVGCGAV